MCPRLFLLILQSLWGSKLEKDFGKSCSFQGAGKRFTAFGVWQLLEGMLCGSFWMRYPLPAHLQVQEMGFSDPECPPQSQKPTTSTILLVCSLPSYCLPATNGKEKGKKSPWVQLYIGHTKQAIYRPGLFITHVFPRPHL